MTIIELLEQIKSGKIVHNLFIFYGAENTVRNIYIDQMVKATGKQRIKADNIRQLQKRLGSGQGLISETPKIFIVYHDEEFQKNEGLQNSIGEVIGGNTLILVYPALDKRTKFYIRYEETGQAVEFEALEENILVKYAKREINLEDRDLSVLVKSCGGSYSKLLLDIDKIKRCGKEEDYRKIMRKLIQIGGIQTTIEDLAFKFVDAVISRNRSLSFELADKADSPFSVIGLLYSNIRSLLMVQVASQRTTITSEISKITGLTSWQIGQVSGKIGKYEIGELESALKEITKVEQGIKTGRIPAELALDYLLVKIL